MRGAAILGLGLAILFGLIAVLLHPLGLKPALEVSWKRLDFGALKGWAKDDHLAALAAFRRSCTKFDAYPDDRALGPYGTAADWRAPCALARTVAPGDAAAARSFFEASFVPLRVVQNGKTEGLFTGYYEPSLNGSRTPDARYAIPLLARPPNLLTADLGAFKDSLKGLTLTGRVIGNKFVPYAERREIEEDIIEGVGKNPNLVPVLWVDDPVAAFFLQIQGSGRIDLTDGSVVRVGYDAQNGRPYTPIGRVLIQSGALEKGKVTMRALRTWLKAHPGQARDVMDKNASYVFFRELPVDDPTLGPPGALGVPLTPGRSLAVDKSIHALGVPMWLQTDATPEDALERVPPLARLMVAQDTGGAITGAVRGDVFYGFGPAAEDLAGAMQATGTLAVLVPPAVAERLLHGPRG